MSKLQQQAIAAAKRLDWNAALLHNASLLELNPQDTGALNRTAVAYLQLGNTTKAKTTFNQVLAIDKSNSIAHKHLTRLKSKQKTAPLVFSKEHFIEEPGKTKIVELHRLASKVTLNKLNVGQRCQLVTKKRYVSVETEDGKHIGALPEDLSFRLCKLIRTGNQYVCFVRSVSEKHCSVYLKEIKRSKRNATINSFPITKSVLSATNDIDERFLLEEDVPLEIVHTDTDQETSLDDIKHKDDEE